MTKRLVFRNGDRRKLVCRKGNCFEYDIEEEKIETMFDKKKVTDEIEIELIKELINDNKPVHI